MNFEQTAKCIIGANNAIIPTYTAMQYPTVVRNFGVGMGNLAAGVALILVPYMWLLVRRIKSNLDFRPFRLTQEWLSSFGIFSIGTHRSLIADEYNGSVRSDWSNCVGNDERCSSVIWTPTRHSVRVFVCMCNINHQPSVIKRD